MISEVGILAFRKSDAMKRRSPMGVEVQTSRKRSRFVCERMATMDGIGSWMANTRARDALAEKRTRCL